MWTTSHILNLFLQTRGELSKLDALQSWVVQNNMKLTPKKCKEMLISFLQDQPDVPRLYIDGLPLELVNLFKVFGLTLNDKPKWQECGNDGEKGS